jgi:cell division protein FtsL
MDSWSTENEGKSGKIGRIDMNGVIGYSQDGKTRMPIPKGKKVRLATEYEGVKITPASVGTVWVMIENSDGDLIAGTVCLVVRDRINWDWERTDAEAKAKAETERVAKLAAIAVPPPQMQAAPQPPPAQIEVAQVNLTKIEVEFQGEKTTSRIELDRFDSKNIKFVQIWGDGHRVYFDGQRSANLIKGFYRHMVNGKMEEYNFILDPQNMRGECEQPGNKYASFRLM